MWFFYLKILLVEIWLTLATWSKSTISNHHHQMFKKKIDFFLKSLCRSVRHIVEIFVADGINSVGDYNSPPGGCRVFVCLCLCVSPPFFQERTRRFWAQKGRKPNCDGRYFLGRSLDWADILNGQIKPQGHNSAVLRLMLLARCCCCDCCYC